MVDLEDDRGCEAEKPKKPEKSPEELAAIALLDRLRSGPGSRYPRKTHMRHVRPPRPSTVTIA